MNCQRAREVFPELIDRRTPPSAHLEARAHLAGCLDCQKDFAALNQVAVLLDTPSTVTPSPRLRRDFYAMLEEEKHSAASVQAAVERKHDARVTSLWRWVVSPLAACALVAVGFVGGLRFGGSAPVPASGGNIATQQKIADLEQKVESMGQLVSYSLLQQQQRPTHERLRGLLTSSAAEQPNARVVNELISALALDPSAHVRLRALDGLFPLLDQEIVRAGVLACLPREENPIVQVAIIDLLASAREASARPAIERISQSEAIDRSVRDAARRALAQL